MSFRTQNKDVKKQKNRVELCLTKYSSVKQISINIIGNINFIKLEFCNFWLL